MAAEREARLPKWARDELATLRRQLADAQRHAEEARLATDPDGSSAVLDAYGDNPIGLGRDARVRLKVGDSWADVRVRNDERVPFIEVMGEGLAGGQMFVQPWSSNLIRVYMGRIQ